VERPVIHAAGREVWANLLFLHTFDPQTICSMHILRIENKGDFSQAAFFIDFVENH
jgi:hypothetical protein